MLARPPKPRNERRQTDPDPARHLALQREGALDARLQADPPRAPLAAAGNPYADLLRAEVAAAAAAVPGPLGRAKGLVGLYARAYTGLRFGVGDLTAASIFYPVVGPAEGPLPADAPTPPAFERFRDGIKDRPGYIWVEETFRRHRFPARSATAAGV